MSRDTKVGLGIVFSFVFLFGTIVVHRFQRSTTQTRVAGEEGSTHDSGAGSGQAGGPIGGPGSETSGSISESVTVEGVQDSPGTGVDSPFNQEPTDNLFPRQPKTVTRSTFPTTPGESSSLDTESPNTASPIVVSGPGRTQADIRISQRSGSDRIEIEPESDEGDRLAMDAVAQSTEGDEGSLLLLPNDQAEIPADGAAAARALIEEAQIAREGTASGRGGAEDEMDRPGIPVRSAEGATEIADDQEGREIAQDLEADRSNEQAAATDRAVTSRDAGQEPEPPEEIQFPPKQSRPPIRQVAGDDPSAEPDPSTSRPPAYHKVEPTIESVADDGGIPPSSEPADSTEPSSHRSTPRDPRERPLGSNSISGQRSYTVQEGDSYWSISARFYGSGKYFRALEKYNADRMSRSGGDPSKKSVLRAGTVIFLPELSVLRGSAGSVGSETAASRQSGSETVPPSRSYRVQEYDTLSSISQRVLGTSRRWQEIYDLNRDRVPDPHRLAPGTELRMPVPRTEEKVADRPRKGR